MQRLLRDLMTKPARRKPRSMRFEAASLGEAGQSGSPARMPLQSVALRLGAELTRRLASPRLLQRKPLAGAITRARARLAEWLGIPGPARPSVELPKRAFSIAPSAHPGVSNALRLNRDLAQALGSNADRANARRSPAERASAERTNGDLERAIGAGALPPQRDVPEHWRAPEREVPAPPDLRESGRTRAAWVDPARAAVPSDEREGSACAFADLVSAASSLAAAVGDPSSPAAACHSVIAVRRSPALLPARLALATPSLSIVGRDPRAAPSIGAERTSGASLTVHPARRDEGGELWLAGLWLEGRLELELARAEVDVRWCTIGQPGATAIRWLAGAADGASRSGAADRCELELRLYGCVVSAIEVPPGVRVVAAGCTFDAGSRAAVAIAARGADLHLVHCTIHGAVEAGELRASSSVFAGAVRVERRDQGWLRHCLLPARGGAPRAYRSLDCVVQFASTSPASPAYLLLSESNGAAALANGEHGRLPGAHDDRGRRWERVACAAPAPG